MDSKKVVDSTAAFNEAVKKAKEIAKRLSSTVSSQLVKNEPANNSTSSNIDISAQKSLPTVVNSLSQPPSIFSFQPNSLLSGSVAISLNENSKIVNSIDMTGVVPPSGYTPKNEEVHESMLVSNAYVGQLIGKGGDNIKKLQEQSQCKMWMTQDGIYASGPDKLMNFVGHKDNIEVGKRLVIDFIDSLKNALGTNNNNTNTLNGGAVRIEATIPREAVGLIIGKNGDTIKKINIESDCKVYFPPETNTGNCQRVCVFEGLAENIQVAQQKVRELVDMALTMNGIKIQDIYLPEGCLIEEVPIAVSMATVLTAKNSEKLQQMNEMTGAFVVLNRNVPENGISKHFLISGNRAQIDKAKQMIRDLVGESRMYATIAPTNCNIHIEKLNKSTNVNVGEGAKLDVNFITAGKKYSTYREYAEVIEKYFEEHRQMYSAAAVASGYPPDHYDKQMKEYIDNLKKMDECRKRKQ